MFFDVTKYIIDNRIIIISLTNVPAIKPTGIKQIRKKIVLDNKSS